MYLLDIPDDVQHAVGEKKKTIAELVGIPANVNSDSC